MGLFDFMRGQGRLSQGPTRPQLYQTETYTPQTSNNVKAALNDPNAPQYITANRMTLNRPGATGGPVMVNPLPPMPQERQTNVLTDAGTYMKQVDEFAKFSNADLGDKLIALGAAFSKPGGGAEYIQNYEKGIRDRFTERRNQELEARRKDYGDIQYVGDANTGKLMRQNKTTGQLEDVTSQYPESVLNAFKAQYRATKFSGKTLDPRTGNPISAAEQARDKAFGKELVDNPTVNMAQDIASLDYVLTQLKGPNAGDLTGTSFSNPIESIARYLDSQGDIGIRAAVDPKSKDFQDIVNRITQQSLRATLGAQFTQREGFMLIQRAYDVRLSPEMNARRIAVAKEAMLMMKQEREAQEKYFNENGGTLAGYVSPIASSIDAMNARIMSVYQASDYHDEDVNAVQKEEGVLFDKNAGGSTSTSNNQTGSNSELDALLNKYQNKNK